jgi:predicted phage tail component-like protein
MYNFIDVNEASESVVLPSEALKINGAYIEEQISGYRTLSVSGREALSPDVETYATGIRDGSKIKNKRYPERIITVTYQLIAESSEAFREAYNKLAQILNVEDAELIFDDEPDKFFTGTPCTIGSVEPGLNSVVGEFEILCADPFKYSVIEYEAESSWDEKSILIDYNGTYKGYPTLVAEFFGEDEASEDGETEVALTGNGDCGYVAFFNESKKIIQIGDPDEVDGNAYAKSQTLVNSSFKTKSAWGTAAKSKWKVNSGTTSSSVVEQKGSLAMGVASYALGTQSTIAASGTTSGTLLSATSKSSTPYINYKVVAKATNRTADTVKVDLSITGSLATDSNYFLSRYILTASVYIGGSWRNVTLKKSTDQWRGKTGHTANLTVTVTGLSATTSELTGIKFKVTRGDSLGTAGVLKETACQNLKINQYVAPVPLSYYLSPSSFGTGEKWHGPSITRTIPKDAAGDTGAANFTLSYSHKMCIGSGSKGTSQLGSFQVMLSDASKNIVCGVSVYKGSSGKKAKVNFYVSSKVVETIEVDLSYNNSYFNSGKTSTITKSGKSVSFNIGGIKKTFRNSNIANVQVSNITITMTQYGTKTALAYNGLHSVKFVKNNCDTWKDVPNKFSANDVVEAHCGNGEIYLNGVHTPALGALGNDWEEFYLTPGLNQIGFSCSEWVTDDYAPKPKVRYREVFL